jgi:hypothetical protein
MSLCKFEDQKLKLVYRASRDGFGAADFHKKCDNIPYTLTIIKTSNSYVFGGYTSIRWSSYEGFKEDNFSFLFSLTNHKNEKLLIKCSNPSNAIYCNENCGPCFGDDDIKISNKSDENLESESALGFTYGNSRFKFNSVESKTFLAGSQHFQTLDIEVYCKYFDKLTQVYASFKYSQKHFFNIKYFLPVSLPCIF